MNQIPIFSIIYGICFLFLTLLAIVYRIAGFFKVKNILFAKILGFGYALLFFAGSVWGVISYYPFIIEKNLPEEYYQFPQFAEGYLRNGKIFFVFCACCALIFGFFIVKIIAKFLATLKTPVRR